MFNTMKEQIKKTADKKVVLSKFDIFATLFILFGRGILGSFLPSPIVVILMAIVVIEALLRGLNKRTGKTYSLFGFLKSLVKGLFRLSSIGKMSDETFSQSFQNPAISSQVPIEENAFVPVAAVESFMPSYACVQEMTPAAARVIALSWWDEDTEFSVSGSKCIEEIIQEVTLSDTPSQAILLNDYKDRLDLPSDPRVLTQLVSVMKENGLVGEFNVDGNFIIFWGQSPNGKEAAQ